MKWGDIDNSVRARIRRRKNLYPCLVGFFSIIERADLNYAFRQMRVPMTGIEELE